MHLCYLSYINLPIRTRLLGFVLMFQEEQEYVELVAAEKHQQEAVKSALAQNKTLSMLDEILEDVRKAADRLEEEIEEHAFDNNKQVSKQSMNMDSLHLRDLKFSSQDTTTTTTRVGSQHVFYKLSLYALHIKIALYGISKSVNFSYIHFFNKYPSILTARSFVDERSKCRGSVKSGGRRREWREEEEQVKTEGSGG